MSVDDTSKDKVIADATTADEAVETAVEEVATEVDTELDTQADAQVDAIADVETVVIDAAEEEAAAAPAPQAEERPEPAPAQEPAAKPKPKPERTSRPAQSRRPKPADRPAPKQASGPANLGMGAWIGICVAALVLGIVVGKFLLGGAGGAGGSLGGKLSVTEAELDTAVATYSYKGSSKSITAREVILQNSSLEASKDADGNYAIPSADTVLSVARNAIIKAEAESRGLTVSEEELASYAEETLGSSDYASIATSYSMDEASVKELLTNSCLMTKLREEVIEGDTSATMPEAPTAPEAKTETRVNEETGEEEEVEVDTSDVATADYAKYIIDLAGDEWDAQAGTWKSADGPYASALASYEVKADSATYEAAQAAYYVAYQQYSESQSAVSTQWSDFVNGLLSNASIQISTLVA